MTRQTQHIDSYVGLRIAAARSAMGLSQSALAERLGVSFQQVQKYEKGTNRVSASRLYDVAGILGLSVEELFPTRGKTSSSGTSRVPLSETAEGRMIEDAFPRIEAAAVRLAVARVVQALASS